MECNLVWRWYAWFQNRNHKYDFRPKFHSIQFSYHFKSVLKSHNFMALNVRFWCSVPSRAGLLEIAEPETLSYSVCKAMSCDENSFKHNKQTNSSEVRTETVSFICILYLHKSHNTPLLPPKILHNHCCNFSWDMKMSQGKYKTMPMQKFWGGRSGVLWYCASRECIKFRFSSPESMMEDLPFFCGWGWNFSLSLEKEFKGTASAVLQWISFELWTSLDCTIPSCGEFSPLNTVQWHSV